MQRNPEPHRQNPAPRQLLLLLCGVVVVALTMSRHWVICTHDDGDAHLEINHLRGDPREHVGCDCGHGDDGTRDGQDGDGQDPQDTCSHIDLLVEVGPQQDPDSLELPLLLAFELPPSKATAAVWRTATRRSLPPPATGPPRPRRFLAARATTVLLI